MSDSRPENDVMTTEATMTTGGMNEAESGSAVLLHPVVKCPSITHLDLFSGIGGFALAAQVAGFTTIGFSEIEPYACKILKRHWPTVPNFGDIRNVRGLRADLITGGFPCQPYSTAGKRGGASDDRALWPEMFRVIGETRPAWVLGENVPGIISMELDRVLDDLESIGYAAWPIGIPACAVDAKHRRERVWIVAYSEHERRNSAALNRKSASDDRGQAQPQEQAKQPSGSNPLANTERISAGARRPERSEAGQETWCRWQPEPELGRVADGIPNRSHRLRGLGNAIVPQVAEMLIREMARTLNEKADRCRPKSYEYTRDAIR